MHDSHFAMAAVHTHGQHQHKTLQLQHDINITVNQHQQSSSSENPSLPNAIAVSLTPYSKPNPSHSKLSPKKNITHLSGA
jgi:hypothetical protein